MIDNGPGIVKPEARVRVFERFYRASSHADGTGLGLPIVREDRPRRQGGTVTLEPWEEGGVGLVATVEMRLWSAAAVRCGQIRGNR